MNAADDLDRARLLVQRLRSRGLTVIALLGGVGLEPVALVEACDLVEIDALRTSIIAVVQGEAVVAAIQARAARHG